MSSKIEMVQFVINFTKDVYKNAVSVVGGVKSNDIFRLRILRRAKFEGFATVTTSQVRTNPAWCLETNHSCSHNHSSIYSSLNS